MRGLRRIGFAVAALGVVMAVVSARASAPQDQPKAKPKAEAGALEHWQGTLKVRPGLEMPMVLHLKKEANGTWTGTLDSPGEGFEGLKLDPVARDGQKLSFSLKVSGATYEGKLNAGGDEVAGTWSQRGANLPLTFKKTDTPMTVAKIVGPEQIWEGKLEAGAGISLRIVVHMGKTADGTLMATLDSPDQGARGLKVDTITLDKSALVFEMKRLMARYEGKLNAEGTEAVGTWTQAGNELPLTLKKTEKASERRRPQTPRPPFPYKVVDVKYPGAGEQMTLAGTLTEPEGDGPFPAVILISGSGAQDRDETLFEHKPFLVLADALTRRGIAVLRVDDRGVGGSTGSTMDSTTDDFAGDVMAGLAFLKSRSEIDAKHLGLIGHSEGGIIAPLVASRSGDAAFIVLMAGTGLPGEDILYLQGQAILKAMGAEDGDLKLQLEMQKQIFQALKSEKDEKALETRLREVVKSLLESQPEKTRKKLANMEGLIEGQLKMVRSAWFRYFLTFDPRPTLAKVRCPVLAIIGEKDLQVPPRENLAAIESTLKGAGNDRVTVKELPQLNHLFQTCKTGTPSEYAEIEETLSPSALSVIGDWIEARVKGR
jgi:pimeloyl-ACP methyl ester carboxylesterase